MTLRAGLIGCGRIGFGFQQDVQRVGIASHAGAYAALDGLALQAVADPDLATAKRCATLFGAPDCRVFRDPAEMLATTELDVISIASPDELHAGHLDESLNVPQLRGILLEKPLALSTGEAESLLSRIAACGIPVLVNYSRRFCSAHQAVRQAIISGELGEIRTVTGFYGKGLRHNGTHWLDLARWFFGELALHEVRQSHAQPFGIDATPNVILSTASGLLLHLYAADDRDYTLFEMDIVGTHGRVRVLDGGLNIEWYRVEASPYFSGYQQLVRWQTVSGLRDSLLHAVANLRDAVTQGAAPLCSADDAAQALRLACQAAACLPVASEGA